jgi:hypothetical protein
MPDEARHLQLVFDDQNAHAAILTGFGGSCSHRRFILSR